MSKPSGSLSAIVQGLWSATVRESDALVKTLYADGGMGIIFNLFGKLRLGNETLPEGVILQPVKKRAENIVLAPGARLAGIRFHPAIGYGILGKHYERPSLLMPEEDRCYQLNQIYAELRVKKDQQCQLDVLSQWAASHFESINVIPACLDKAIKLIEQGEAPGKLSGKTGFSQRQVERYFRFWLGLTPKHYQRICRVKKTISFLRQYKNANLADVTHQFGFSDQAHMTREFRAIARITPGQL